MTASTFDQRVSDLLATWDEKYAELEKDRQPELDATRPAAVQLAREQIHGEAIDAADAKRLTDTDLDKFVAGYVDDADVDQRADAILAGRFPSVRASAEHDRAHAKQFVRERMAEEAAAAEAAKAARDAEADEAMRLT